jgi:hypothetical protein
MLYINKNYVNLYQQNQKGMVVSPKSYLQQRTNSTATASNVGYGQKLNVQLQQQYL